MSIYKPVANLPLIKPPRGCKTVMIKGCNLGKGIHLNPDDLYLFLPSKEAMIVPPPEGFYKVEGSALIVYVKSFRPYFRTDYRTITPQEELEMSREQCIETAKWRMFIFVAQLADSPKDFVPDERFDYKQANRERILGKNAQH